ncbi:hypothetical protein [Bradyrhizobium sp. USDA 4452]
MSELAPISIQVNVVIPSIQPTKAKMPVPTVAHSTRQQRDLYTQRLCETLNGWVRGTEYVVTGSAVASDQLGIGVAVLRKSSRSDALAQPVEADVLHTFDRLRRAANPIERAFTAARGITVFDQDNLYLLKSIGHRYWTETAALNDADEIAGTILMHIRRLFERSCKSLKSLALPRGIEPLFQP